MAPIPSSITVNFDKAFVDELFDRLAEAQRDVIEMESARDKWEALAVSTIEILERQDAHVERLANELSREVTLNDGLRQHLAWYHRLDAKRGYLEGQHRLNGQS